MENSLRRFTDQFGVGEARECLVLAATKKILRRFETAARGYQNDQDYNPTCGYVMNTNVPKHLGSIVWSAGWQIFISERDEVLFKRCTELTLRFH
jgi:hypothetical protein